MKSPIIDIQIGGENISNFISDFQYDDSLDKDNILVLIINAKDSLEFLNRKDISINSDIKFQFGYLKGLLSEAHISKISDIHANYSQQGIRTTITGLDVGNYLKKTSSKTVFKQKTSSDIAEEIAIKNGLNYDIDVTTKVWENMPQGNVSDLKFLQGLAEKENDFVCYIRGNRLFFTKRGLDKESQLTFTYGKDIISFRPKQRTSSSDATSSKVRIVETNPYTGEYDLIETNNATSDEDVLNSKKVNFQIVKNTLNETLSDDATREKEVVMTSQDTEEIENVSKTLQQRDKLKSNEAELIIEGNPLLKPQEIVTIKGVAQRHSGNWQIISIKHKINSSGFTSSLMLQTNGTNDGGNIEADTSNNQTNSTVGNEDKEINKELKIFGIDENGGEFSGENKILNE